MKRLFKILIVVFLINFTLVFSNENKNPLPQAGELWATYFGGNNTDVITDAIVINGFIYVTGTTNSPNSISSGSIHQPSKSAGTDAFLAKFDADGNLIWSTYYGGNNNDNSTCMVFDPESSHVVIAGFSSSTNLILTNLFNNLACCSNEVKSLSPFLP